MKKIIILYCIPLFLTGCMTLPYEPIKAEVGEREVNVTWKVVDNIPKTCKAVGAHAPFGTQIIACAYWQGSDCTIFTDKKPSYEIIGHELRHCFDKNWHN